MIEPFANNHQSMQIGELVIENQQDKITIYGDIDVTRCGRTSSGSAATWADNQNYASFWWWFSL